MADILTDTPKFGDSDDTLIAKLAAAAQDYSDVVASAQIETSAAQTGQKNTNLLRLAYAAQNIL